MDYKVTMTPDYTEYCFEENTYSFCEGLINTIIIPLFTSKKAHWMNFYGFEAGSDFEELLSSKQTEETKNKIKNSVIEALLHSEYFVAIDKVSVQYPKPEQVEVNISLKRKNNEPTHILILWTKTQVEVKHV